MTATSANLGKALTFSRKIYMQVVAYGFVWRHVGIQDDLIEIVN